MHAKKITASRIRYLLSNLIIALVLVTFSVLCVYPLIYCLFASFSDPFELMQHSGILLHSLGFTVKGYEILFSYEQIWRGLLNTTIIIVLGVTVNMCATTLSAYVLSRRELYIHRFLNLMVIFTMYFGGGMIPTFLVVKGVGLLDTLWALILPGAIGTTNMIILRTAIDGTPQSLFDAAKIDGANDFDILVKIIVPLVKSTLAVLVLYYAVGHWNSWFNAMLYLDDYNKYPLQLHLREILITDKADLAEQAGFVSDYARDKYKDLIKYCTTIFGTVPMLCFYPFLQKYFVKGVMIGSVKG